MVTKANPRDFPVNLSCISSTSVTAPACANMSCNSSSVVVNGKLPTYNRFPINGLDFRSRRLTASRGIRVAGYSPMTDPAEPDFSVLIFARTLGKNLGRDQ